jgi:kynureninase
MITLQHCQSLDSQDVLRPLREHFSLPPGVVYLDGNSLGAMPKAAAARVAEVVNKEWGHDLIQSWNTAGWFAAPQKLGDQLAGLIGAKPGEVVATDSTSINLYKVLFAAIQIAKRNSEATDKPMGRTILSDRANFPTDLYIAQSLCEQFGMTLQLADGADMQASLSPDVGILMLTHVNYRTGAMFDMRGLTAAAHAVGALAIWDLAHSAGAVPVDLHDSNADFAVGCGYKYLNGGPGAPAFVWVHPRHAEQFSQPFSGWWGHAAPFQFTPDYRPAKGIGRYLCGTQPMISMAALGCGLDVFDAANAYGGMAALRTKSLALTDLFIDLVRQRCDGHGLSIETPLPHCQRGSQVCLGRKTGAFAIVQALIARGVIGDFRAGDGAADLDILRFGFTPLYLGFVDVWQAVQQLLEVLESGEWQDARFNQQHAVT